MQQGREVEIEIVGAGMSGLAMGILLKKAGYERFRIREKAESVGGTWRENRYPGLTCDVPSFFYAYSFEPNLDWSHRFSPGAEIRAYFERVAEKYGLLEHITFGDAVESAVYEDGGWSVDAAKSGRSRADVVIAATGPLHHKKYPEIDGLADFEGELFHSANWNDDLALGGKRIGVVGNGSTGVQMMTPLSEVASRLTLFQRTPQWIFPIGNKRYSERERAWTRRLPILGALTRAWYKRLFEMSSSAVVEEGWLRRRLGRGCRQNLEEVADPELRRRLTPDYEPGCKRLVLSTEFYTTMQKPNVELVTESIERIEPGGVRTRDGALHELDVLVLATGFRPHMWGVDRVVGADGLSLKEAWAKGTRSYRSVAIPGFPNYFMIAGPNSPLGNISVIDTSETQARYVVECIRRLEQNRGHVLSPTHEATARFHQALLAAMDGTVWVTGCDSWYLDDDGVPMLWPWSAGRFHEEMRAPDFDEFELVPA